MKFKIFLVISQSVCYNNTVTFKEGFTMNAAQIIVNILLILSSIVMIITVMLQSSDSDGMAGLTGGNSETFFGKTL